MIDWLASEYAAAGDPVDDPAPATVLDEVTAAERLLAAIGAGDLDEVDSLAVALLTGRSAHALLGLVGEGLVTSLAAAGHAPIGFALLRRVQPVLPSTLLRGALRGLAARPEWQVHWHHEVDGVGHPTALYHAMRVAPMLGSPGNDFIHPLMSQVQDSGVAASLLGPVLSDRFDVAAAAQVLARIATWSMVHDNPEQAPYGWSHALTMPQAVMSTAGAGVTPRAALAVAATFTLGFRVAHGVVELPETIRPGEGPDATIAELARAASLHRDAHLVKHTLACIHAAADDPTFAPLHLRAAERLVRWWGA
jgi:hypothetical protein